MLIERGSFGPKIGGMTKIACVIDDERDHMAAEIKNVNSVQEFSDHSEEP